MIKYQLFSESNVNGNRRSEFLTNSPTGGMRLILARSTLQSSAQVIFLPPEASQHHLVHISLWLVCMGTSRKYNWMPPDENPGEKSYPNDLLAWFLWYVFCIAGSDFLELGKVLIFTCQCSQVSCNYCILNILTSPGSLTTHCRFLQERLIRNTLLTQAQYCSCILEFDRAKYWGIYY